MAGVTKEQIRTAKQMSAIEFLRKYRPDELEKAGSRGEFQLRSHDSFKINGTTSVWHWKSRDIGGKSALDYLIHVEGMGFVAAVRELCEERPSYVPPPKLPIEKAPFALPAPAADNRCVQQYLLKRGIGKDVIENCIYAGILYESAEYHNAVFVGRDEAGVARYAFLRGTYLHSTKPFRIEASGSDKAFCFCVSPNSFSKQVAVYESAIDTLAHWTLEGTADKYRLSLGGIYAPKQGDDDVRQFKASAALTGFLARHPEIETIEICTDNDHAGHWAAEHIQQEYEGRYRVIQNLPSIEDFDYANMAEEKMKERAARQRAACSR